MVDYKKNKEDIGSVVDIIFMESRNNTVPGKDRVNGGNIFRKGYKLSNKSLMTAGKGDH